MRRLEDRHKKSQEEEESFRGHSKLGDEINYQQI